MDRQLPFPPADEPDSPKEASPEELAHRRAEQQLSIDTVAVGIVGVEQARIALQAGRVARTRVERPCPTCRTHDADVRPNSQHLTAHCARCGSFIYHVPRHELGLAPRPVSDRAKLPPSRRVHILERDHARCVLCGRAAAHGVELTVDHLLSWDDGLAMGAPRELLDDDLNLAAMCQACQLGKGRVSVPVALYISLLLLHVERARHRGLPLRRLSIRPPHPDEPSSRVPGAGGVPDQSSSEGPGHRL